jgi:Transposase IS66 family
MKRPGGDREKEDRHEADPYRRIGEIDAIEARLRGNTASERVAIRQAETKPSMEALWSWPMERLEPISAKSSLASAIRYTLGRWNGLTLFLSDGRVEVDNNTVERGIRPNPLGRNYVRSRIMRSLYWRRVHETQCRRRFHAPTTWT